MVKKVYEILRPPQIWRRPVILLLGIIAGLGIYSIYVSRAWMYMSDKPEACINCHVMAPQYATWMNSSHKNVAHCNDCHVPHNNFAEKYYFKAMDGLNHTTKFTLRAERQAIIIGDAGRRVVKDNCIRCHSNLIDQSKLVSQTKGKHQVHNTDRDCWECHREVPHGRVRSLSSTPNTLAPVPESPVPGWLKKIMDK